jgi:nucleoside-diphosphate-sugar epimerase
MKRVLLIGGAGNLGFEIISKPIKEVNYAVIDDFSSSAVTKDEISSYCEYILDVDVCDLDQLNVLFDQFRPTDVYYLATNLGNDPRKQFDSNVYGLRNTMTLGEAFGQPHIYYFQSFLTRDASQVIDEFTNIRALDSYSTWKLAGEFLLKSYRGPHTNLILGSVLTSRLNLGLVPTLITRITQRQSISITHSSRDYVSPNDFHDSLQKVLWSEMHPQTLVLGSEISISSEKILLMLCDLLKIEKRSLDVNFVSMSASNPRSIELKRSDFFESVSSTHNTDLSAALEAIIFFQSQTNSTIRQHHDLESK